MPRRLVQSFLVFLAIVFLIEAWLWDHLEPVVARVVALIPLRVFKAWLAAQIARLSPALTLIVFVIPIILLFPLKVIGLWLLAHHYWLGAMATILFAKLMGVGVAAFIFDVTRPKLLQMGWFRRLYEWVLVIRARATELVAPVTVRLKAAMMRLRADSASRWLRSIRRLRRRVQSVR
jgi:hypothetical protein